MNTKLFLTTLLLIAGISFAQSQNYWVMSDNTAKGKEIITKKVTVSYFNVYTLDLTSFNQALESAPMRGENSKNNALLISFPNTDGQFVTYSVVEAPVLHPDLGANFPGIKSYAGQGVDNPAMSIRFSVSPQRGLYGMIFNEDEGTSFIDPYSTDFTEYMVYDKKDMVRTDEADFTCTMADTDNHSSEEQGTIKATNDKKLRRYRLALCCNAEYGNIFIGSATTNHQKYANILAQMNITMTRVNGVYEKELAITMQIIPNDTLIIYFGSTSTDPWSGEFNTKTAQTIDAAIGIANYDIGHNFNTSGGGNAGCIACVCLGSTSTQSGTHKGRGMTGRSDPTGDAFDIDYVAHEMGHQFGGYHTMNTCSRSGSGTTEVEICSGTTIMGYAGICNPNVQMNSDDYFAYVNIRDISANVQSGNSASCAQVTSFTNNPPTANAGSDYTIPKSTAFVLTGIGSDPDGNAITYTWEENDPGLPPGSATTAPVSTWTTGPMFRSIKGTTSPLRYFPVITSIIANNLTPTWEVVPSVGRTLNFSLCVKDNVITGGQTANDLMVVTVNGTAGPFTVSAPNTAVTWAAGSTQTVTWNVASTTASPVSCANVDIFLSTDGGYTYPITILANTPNDGTESITVPNNPATTCRVMVKGAGNIFFDISNVNFTITGSTNSISGTTISGSPFCAGASVSVPYTKSGTFNAGNIFTAQLSDASGSFTAPVSIGTLTSVNSGTISATIPAGTTTGTGYRIRVVSSSPVTTGADNGTNLTINAILTPAVSIAGTSTICTGTSSTFTATPTNGGTPTYQWKLNGSNVGTGATYTNAALVNGNTIQCIMTTTVACPTAPTATSNLITMVVNPIPSTPSATSNTPICTGASINLTTPTLSGATYSWSGPNSFTSTSQNPTITGATSIMAGAYSVSVTLGGCTSLPGATNVTVNTAPATPTASSNSPVCTSSAINLTTPTVTGATYSWTGPNGFTSTQQNPTVSSATAAMAGTYSVSVTIGGCASLAGTTSVAINSSPVAAFTASPTSTMCSGAVQFTDNTTGNPSSWLWNFGDGQTSTTQSPAYNYITSGTYTVTLTSTNNCGNNQIVKTNYITINIPNAPTATGASRCGTGTVPLTGTGTGVLHWFSSATGGTDLGTGTSYTTPSISSTTTYYLENHLVQASQNVGPLSTFATGQYSNTAYTLNFNCLAPCTLVSVAVDKQTAGNVLIQLTTSTGTVLQSGTFAVPAGASRVTLNWPLTVGTGLKLVGPAAWLYRVNTPGTFPYTLAGLVSITSCSSGTRYGSFYDWEIKQPDCVSGRIPVVATINTPAPVSASISASTTSICTGSNVTFTAIPTNGGTTPTYQWQVNGANVGTGGSTYSSSTLANGNIVTCILTSNGTCVSGSPATSNAITMNVQANLPASVAIASNLGTTICAGQNVTFTATPTNGGTPIYEWKLNGSVVGTNSPTYANSSLTNGDFITCTMTSSLGCSTGSPATSSTITMAVTPTVTPTVSISTTTPTICAGTSVSFTASPSNGGTTPNYQWQVNGTNAGTNSSTFTSSTLANGNNVTCIMTSNANCPSTPTATSNNVVMAVNPLITPAVSINASATTICSGASVTFTASPTNGGTTPTYQWFVNSSAAGSGLTYTNSSLINNDVVSCIITSNATCLTSPTANSNNISMTVNPNITPDVSISATNSIICPNDQVTFTATPTNGGTTPGYQWNLNGNSAGTGATFTSSALSNNDVVVCILTSSELCSTLPTVTSNTITMTVNPTVNPSVNIVVNPSSTVCPGTIIVFTANPTQGGTPTYLWTVDGVNAGTNSTLSGTFTNEQAISCTMTSTVACADPATVNATLLVDNIATVDPVSISDISGVLNSDATSGNQWYEQSSGLISGATSQDYTPTADGNYYTIVTDINGCTSTSNIINFTYMGIASHSSYSEIKIYPNPTSGILNISFGTNIHNGQISIEDHLGQTVYSGIIEQSKGSVKTMNLDKYSNGIYFITIRDANSEYHYKVIYDK